MTWPAALILAAQVGEGVAIAIVGGTLGAIGTMYAARRSSRAAEVTATASAAGDLARAEVDHNVALLSGYDAFAQRLQAELDLTRQRCQAEIDGMRADHDAARARWARERAELEARVEELEAKVVALLTLGTSITRPRRPGRDDDDTDPDRGAHP